MKLRNNNTLGKSAKTIALFLGASALSLTSCRDNDFDWDKAHMNYMQEITTAYAETFTDMFGEIPADQSWDFSKYGKKSTGTRAGVTFPTPNAPTADGNGWYYVPEALTNYITSNLPETQTPSVIDNNNAVSISLPKGSFTIYPVYQGRAQCWDIFMQVGKTHYPLFRKSSNIERSSDGNNWQKLGTDVSWETVYNTAYSGDKNPFWNPNNWKPDMVNGVIYYDKQNTPNNNGNDFRIAEGVNLKAGNYVVAIKANTNKSGFNCPLNIADWKQYSDNGNNSNFVINTSVNLYYNRGYDRRYSEVTITVKRDGWYDFTLQPGSNNCSIQVESVDIVKPGFSPNNLFSGDIYTNLKTNYNNNDWLDEEYVLPDGRSYNPYTSYYGPGHMFVQNSGNDKTDPTHTMGYKVRTKGYTFDLSETHNESDKINFYALITGVPYHYQNTSVGTRQSSIGKQMKFIKVPGNISLNDSKGGVNFDGKTVYIIGLEDADYASKNGTGKWSNTREQETSLADGKGSLQNSDYDYNDLIMIVAFDEEPEIKPYTDEEDITTTVEKRYMVEDLGTTDDIDFNDMVVDIIQTTTQKVKYTIVNGVVTNTENIGDPSVTQKATIRAMGGTLDFDFKINGTTVFTKSKSNYDVGTMYNTEKGNIDYKRLMWEGPVSGWDPDANNVSFQVYNKNRPGNGSSDVVGTSSYEVVFPGLGEVPYIIAFDPTKTWRDERHPICKKWLANEEPAQWEWPEPHDKEGDMTYERWLELNPEKKSGSNE